MKKKFLGIVCLLYACIIVYVWMSKNLVNFLAPTMQIYLKISLIPFIIIGLVLCFNCKINYKFKTTDLILILPLIMLIFADDGRLTTDFAKNRMTSFSSKQKINNAIKKEISKEKVIDESLEDVTEDTQKKSIYNIDIEVNEKEYISLADYVTFEPKASKFKGKNIKLKGFSILNEEYIPKGYFAIGRYAISCCAADAEFTGFIAKYDKAKLKDKTWYEIEGKLEEMEDNLYGMVLAIDVITIKEIDSKNEEAYVYPCYSYDDGTCSSLDKYNLEY